MNRHDSEHLEGWLARSGLAPAAAVSDADLVVLNTCSVREKPVQKVISRLGELASGPRPPVIGVCGCVAQQEGEALLERAPAVGFVLGPGQIPRVGEAADAAAAGDRTVVTGFEGGRSYDRSAVERRQTTRAMVTVIEGCDQYCTFCVVPYTRGHEVSRPMVEVLDEARELARGGFREVELLGQTINAYRCPTTGADFADLLDAVARVPGFARVRYVTSHPRLFGQRLIDVLARHPGVSRYLHLPFQAGSDRILKRMHRRYTRAEYLELIERIRAAAPDVNLSTDVIVGFPGETDADFEQTLDLLRQVRFGQVFAFACSPRPRTPAARYGDPVGEEIKKERLGRLFELTDAIALELNRRLVGRDVEVLIDGPSRRSADDWQGRGDDNRVVNFPRVGTESVGDLVTVRITGAGAHSLRGEQQRRGLDLPLHD
jgi:tRNA-2-methylthio-N6-dimethylallyladenosine synthase